MKQLLLILAMLIIFSVAGCAQQVELKTMLVFEADISTVSSPEDAMADAINVIEKRLDAYGVNGSIVEKQDTNLIVVRLPAVENITEVIALIGKTTLLDFKEQKLDENGEPMLDDWGDPIFQDEPATAIGKDGQEKALTGKYLKHVEQAVDPYEGPIVTFEWDSEGAHLFEQITRRNLEKSLAIYVGDKLISAPVVQSVISDRGQIEGRFTLEEATNLANILNSGTLDVPLVLVEQRDIDKA